MSPNTSDTLVVAPVVSTKLNYDPKINRWTGKPHEHKQEMARRVRQMAKKAGAV